MRKLKIKNWKLRIPVPGGRGYTLIELISVITVFAIVGIIVVSITAFTLRGSKKSDLVENVRLSGNAVLSQMVRFIRYAESIDYPSCVPSATSSWIKFSSLSSTQTTLSCETASNTIAYNGTPLIETNSLLVTDCQFVCRQPTTADAPTVTIQFTLKSNNTSSFLENNVSVPFQTTVSLRNIQ